MKQGAVDFLSKPVKDVDLLRAIRSATEKDHQARAIAGTRRRLATLTPREREVLRHVLQGLLNKQIAAELGIVENTIKVHRGRVMEKMVVRTLAELVRQCERLEIFESQARPVDGLSRRQPKATD